MDTRLPANLEVSGLIRRVQGEGGFATVLHKGHAEAGTILVVLLENGRNARAFERMPIADGSRQWTLSKACESDDPEHRQAFDQFLSRRLQQDSDLWIIELDIAGGERFIGLTTSSP